MKNKNTYELFKWRTTDTLKELFIYFWVTSLLGHYLEVIWAYLTRIVTNRPSWTPRAPTILPLAPPYGLGAVAVILLTVPLIKKYRLNPIVVLILNIIITGAIEYVCAVAIVLYAGHNRFWNYTNQPFNINGYVCLESAVIFGIAATLFLYLIYPLCDKVLHKLKRWQLDVTFWVLFISYAIDLIYLYISGNLI